MQTSPGHSIWEGRGGGTRLTPPIVPAMSLAFRLCVEEVGIKPQY